ncbi:MAG: SWIM zinc finger family protein [Eubacteriales bacterium]|nr:SWIM zinc finger family protein [Eubacteriales bacterium]
MKWENMFQEVILDRGYGYYCDGVVENLDFDGERLTADVYGTRRYEVEIQFDGDEIQTMSCSCPYAADGTPCKHMAAVLYEWYEDEWDSEEEDEVCNISENNKESGNTGTISKKESKPGDSVEEIVADVDEAVVRRFLTEILQSDEKLFLRFKMLIKPTVCEEDMKKHKKRVDDIARRYLGREHFVTYNRALSFIREMEEVLYKEVRMMLDDKCYREAFQLTNHVFLTVAGVDMDDSDGGTEMFADQCLEIWEEILDEADKQMEKEMYDWFAGHLNGSVIDYMEDYIEQFLMNNFDSPEYFQAKLDFTEKKALEAEKSSDLWSASYEASRWALKHIDLLEQSEADWEVIEDYCRKKWKYSGIRNYYSTQCIDREDYAMAITVLRESIKLDEKSPGLVRDYRKKLKDIYRICGKEKEYQKELWKLVTEDDAGNLELFRELKALYSDEEWKDVREKIFSKLPLYAGIDKFYEEEKLYDRLLAFVQKSRGMSVLRQYTGILKEYYPKEILDKYECELENLTYRTANRDRYREWVGILRSMRNIPGGQERVEKIARHWRAVYNNRPAMMDELDKL